MTDHPEKTNDSGQMTAGEVESVVQYRHRRLPTGKGYYGQMGRWCRWHEGIAPFHAPGFEYETRTLYLRPTPPPEVVARHEARELVEARDKERARIAVRQALHRCRNNSAGVQADEAIAAYEAALSRRPPDPACPADVEGKAETKTAVADSDPVDLLEKLRWIERDWRAIANNEHTTPSFFAGLAANHIEALAAQLSEKDKEIERLKLDIGNHKASAEDRLAVHDAQAAEIKLLQEQITNHRALRSGAVEYSAALRAQLAAATARVGEARKIMSSLKMIADMEEREPPFSSVIINIDICRDGRDWLNKEGGNA